MKMFQIISMLCLASLFFISLAAQGAPQIAYDTSSNKKITPTDPSSILLLKENLQDSKYQKIGIIKIASYNFVGIKRQEADINELLQTHAANLGGNAVIDIHSTPKDVYGTVVKI